METTRANRLLIGFSNYYPAIVRLLFWLKKESNDLLGLSNLCHRRFVQEISGHGRITEVLENKIGVFKRHLPQDQTLGF